MYRNKIIVLLMVLVSVLLLSTACSANKYGEVKKILDEYVKVTKDLEKAIDEAKDGKQAAAALKSYFDKMKELSPKVENLPDKYPELKNDTPPAELKGIIDEFEKSTQEFEKIFEKLNKYMDDPDVMKVLSEFDNKE